MEIQQRSSKYSPCVNFFLNEFMSECLILCSWFLTIFRVAFQNFTFSMNVPWSFLFFICLKSMWQIFTVCLFSPASVTKSGSLYSSLESEKNFTMRKICLTCVIITLVYSLYTTSCSPLLYNIDCLASFFNILTSSLRTCSFNSIPDNSLPPPSVLLLSSSEKLVCITLELLLLLAWLEEVLFNSRPNDGREIETDNPSGGIRRPS